MPGIHRESHDQMADDHARKETEPRKIEPSVFGQPIHRHHAENRHVQRADIEKAQDSDRVPVWNLGKLTRRPKPFDNDHGGIHHGNGNFDPICDGQSSDLVYRRGLFRYIS